jgi:hypothetical protein
LTGRAVRQVCTYLISDRDGRGIVWGACILRGRTDVPSWHTYSLDRICIDGRTTNFKRNLLRKRDLLIGSERRTVDTIKLNRSGDV